MRRSLALVALALLSTEVAASQDRQTRILTEIGIDQKPGQQVPLDLRFRDESGREVRLGDYFQGRPVVLAPVYYECPMLCTLVLNGLVASLEVLELEAGRDFEVVAVSFDPAEGPALAAAKKKAYLERSPGTVAGWHFLTGDRPAITALTAAIGFRYAYDEERGEFAHAAAAVVLTPGGVVSRYLLGIDPAPRDVRFALFESSAGRVGTIVDRVLLLCYEYDPASGKYGATIMGVIRLGGILTVAALVGFMIVSRRREIRARRLATGPGA